MKREREQSLTRPLRRSSERLLKAPRSAIRKHAIGHAVHSVLALRKVMDGHRTSHALHSHFLPVLSKTNYIAYTCSHVA